MGWVGIWLLATSNQTAKRILRLLFARACISRAIILGTEILGAVGPSGITLVAEGRVLMLDFLARFVGFGWPSAWSHQLVSEMGKVGERQEGFDGDGRQDQVASGGRAQGEMGPPLLMATI